MFSWFKKKSIKDIKLICFDIDNTLCDFATAETLAEALIMEMISKDIQKLQSKNLMNVKNIKNKKNKKERKVLRSYSAFDIMKIFNDVKTYHMHNGTTPERYSRLLWFKETLERVDVEINLGVNLNRIISHVKSYEEKYWDSMIKNIKNYPNTVTALTYLKSKGLKLATITDSDGRKDIKMIRLKHMGLDKYFDYIITTDDTGFTKPAEINWINLLKISELKASQCVMVGDHPEIDLITAKKLGFITVWTKQNINTDLHQNYVDYEIHDIKEIIDIVKKIN